MERGDAMTKSDLVPAAIGAVVETAFAFANQDVYAPGAGIAAVAMVTYLRNRIAAAQTILQDELKFAGAASAHFRDADQFASAAYCYARAARNQAADDNLRVLVKAMIGLARRQELWADDFLKYADILAGLSRDELILIGRLMAQHKEFYAEPEKFNVLPERGDSHIWLMISTQKPEIFENVSYLNAVAARAQRSGLITLQTGTYGGGDYFYLSPIGIEVREFVDIEEALRK